MTSTWAGVIRVSHMGDRKAGSDTFHADRDQITAIEQAVPDGDRLVMLPAELGVSGGLPIEQRPSLLAAVEGIERGEYAGVIVAYLSRLGRNLAEQLRTYDRVHAAGGEIIVAQERIDARTRGGRLQRNLLAAIHEDEREQHVERFEHLRAVATEAGIWQRRQTPRGYRRDERTRRLVPDRDAVKVRAAFRMRAGGETTASVARYLGMTPSGAFQLLRNRVYLGELRVGKYVNPAAHPALVDESLWLEVQAAWGTRPSRGRTDGPALLAGLVYCTGCGQTMSRSGGRSVMYACRREHSAGQCPAPAAITAVRLEEHVEQIALARLIGLQATAVVDTSGLDRARAGRVQAERELAAYLEAVSAADVGADAFAAGARVRREAVEQAEREETDALRVRAPVIPPNIETEYARMSVGERHGLLRRLIEAVLVERAGRGRVVPVGDRVRVLRAGAGVVHGPYRGGGKALSLVRIDLPAGDDPRVLGVLGA